MLIYVFMGVFYVCNGFGFVCLCVGLLNVGVEEYKGCVEFKVVYEMIVKFVLSGDFEYVGFVEGGDLLFDCVDVIVIDGFMGNVVLKIVEGIVNLILIVMCEVF